MNWEALGQVVGAPTSRPSDESGGARLYACQCYHSTPTTGQTRTLRAVCNGRHNTSNMPSRQEDQGSQSSPRPGVDGRAFAIVLSLGFLHGLSFGACTAAHQTVVTINRRPRSRISHSCCCEPGPSLNRQSECTATLSPSRTIVRGLQLLGLCASGSSVPKNSRSRNSRALTSNEAASGSLQR
jgi:hypothetical protein